MDKKDFMALGAFITGLSDLALEALYMSDPAKWANTWPFVKTLDRDELPPVEDFVVGAGVPSALYILGNLAKSQRVKDLAKGGGIYGTCMLGHHTAARIAYSRKGWPPAARVGQFNIDYDFPTTNIVRRPKVRQFNIDWEPPAVTNLIRSAARSAALLPAPETHSGEVLPFQNDLGY